MNIKQLMQQMDYGPAPEAAELAESWLARYADQGFGHFINGEFVYPNAAEYLPVINPARKQSIGKISKATSADVDQAVAAARAAAPSWASLGGHQRARYLYALARHVQKHARLFAVLESINNGKPIRESRDIDIPLVARHFYHHAGWAELLDTEFPSAQALGVCGQIIPWNFPLLMLAWKIAPALAAGNTVVLKPAEYTPVTAMLFAELCQSVGLPAGVVNIVNGDGDTGTLLVEHPDIDKLAFTGSTEVGQLIRRASAGSGKKLTLELGGKSPFIVFADCDMDAAIEGVVDAVWFNQGEVCCAGSRILVQESAYAAFSAKLQNAYRRCVLVIRSIKAPTLAPSSTPSKCSASKLCYNKRSATVASSNKPTHNYPQTAASSPPVSSARLAATRAPTRKKYSAPSPPCSASAPRLRR